MVRYVTHVFGKAGERRIRLEQMAAEWQGLTLTAIVFIPTREGERFGDNGALLIFKPVAQVADDSKGGE